MNLKLTPKLTLVFIVFAAILLMAVNVLVYNIGRHALEAAAIAELESTAGEKVSALNAWADDKQGDMISLATDPSVVNDVSLLLEEPLSSSQTSEAHDKLVEEFQPRVRSTELLAVLLLDPQTGKVIVSTDPEEEGKARSDRTYFQEGKKSSYITPIYFSQELQSPAMTASTPVRSKDGKLLAVLAGRVNLNELNTIIQRRSGVHQTDDAFLINDSNLLITLPRFLPAATILTTGIHTEPVELCLRHENGTIFANDYRDIPVIATYRWLPGRQMCLIVKISQAEALAPEHSFAVTISWVALAALLIVSIGAVGLSHTIIRPIRAMQTAAQRYGQGDMTVRLPEKHSDELGLLAKEFNIMAATLEEKEDQLRLHSLNLEKQVEARTEELRQSQMRFQALIENAPDGIALLGLDGKLRQVTPSALQILGYPLEDAQGQDPALLTHPDDVPVLLGILTDLIQNPGKVVRVEYRFLHKDGSWRWLESTISNLIAEPGVEAIVFNYRDISQRKRAEAALTESEEKFKYIFDHSVVGKSITLMDGSLSVNKAFCDMLGYSEEELLNKKWQEITHPEDIAISSQMTELLLTDEKDAVSFTKRYIHKNGSTVWADLSIALRRDAEGEPLYFMTTLLDITDRKQMEMQLRDALEFNERILTSSPIGIFIYRLSGECVSANECAAQMVGATVEQLKRQNFHNIDSWKRSGLYELAGEAIATRKLTAADVHVTTSFGKEAWYRAQFVTFRAASEELLLMIFADITERKYAEAALKDSETRYRTLMERSLEAIYIYEKNTGQIVAANPAFLNILGYDSGDIPALTLYDVVAHDHKSIDEYLDQLDAEGDGGISMGERLWRRKDGTTCSMEVTANQMQQGEKDLIFVVGRDITERKQTENALREKERLLSEAQRIGQIGSLSYDITGDTFQFSDEMYHLLDISSEKFQHNTKDFMALVYPADRPDVASWIADLKAGWQIKELHFRLLRRNGELRYLHCKGAVEFNSEGRPARFIGTAQDITERRMAEIQINQQIKRLTALNEIDRAIISGSDQQHTLNVILTQAISQLQVDAADILLLDSDGKGLRYAVGQGFHTKQIEEIHVGLGESHAGRVAKERRLIRIPNLNEQTNDLLFSTHVLKESFVSYIGVPLMVKREVRGVLEVFHRSWFQPYQEWLDFINTLAGQAAIAIENTTLLGTLQTSNQELSQAYDATIEGWSHAMDLRDRETEGHAQRVTGLTVEMARAMGIDETRLTHMRRGALLHDIGKLGIPDSILFKPGELSAEEWEIMQKHPEFAYDMLSSIQYLKPALPIPYLHHEKWDGTGYPLGLRGEQIPLEARIFAVVDVWDALRSDRPYRKAWTVEKTLEHIRSLAGSHFDPRVVDYFMEKVKT